MSRFTWDFQYRKEVFRVMQTKFQLAGSSYGPNVRRWSAKSHEPANLGQCFIAINPRMFASGFEIRMSDLMDTIRDMIPVSG